MMRLRNPVAFAFFLLVACGKGATGTDAGGGGGGADASCAKPCGTECCASDQTCNEATKKCEKQGTCTKNCTGKTCGDDGCGGSCGSCPAGQSCSGAGTCSACTPACAGKKCGPDGCGGSCGSCLVGEKCDDASGTCKACTPACTGKKCGDDGCGGSCGSCAAGETCSSAGACAAGTGDGGTTGDASQPGSDAATTPDAGAGADAALPGADAAYPGVDAAYPGVDAAYPGADAAYPGADAAYPGADAATPGPDAGAPSADGGSTVIANDSCSAPEALVFSNGVATASGDTTSAKGDYRSNGCAGSGNDVVYSFTTSVEQAVEITLTPKSTATSWIAVVYVRKGACAGTAAADEVACKDAPSVGKPVSLSHNRVPPGTYFVFVDGYLGTAGAFDLTIKLSTPPPGPANDTCATPTPLTFTNSVATVQGDTGTATDDQKGTCGSSKGPDLVYSFTIQAAQSVVATVAGDPSSPNYLPTVYIRSKCDSVLAADEKACSVSYYSSTVSAKAQSLAAGTYFVWVDGSSVAYPGKFKLEVKLAAPIVTPTNDTCSSPETLTFTNDVATASSDTTGGKHDTSGTCAGGGKDLVYTFSTVGKGVKNIDLTLAPKSPTSTLQPVVYVRKTCASSASVDSLGCKDAINPGDTVSLSLLKVPEGTYFLFADGFYGSEGAFDLKVTLSEPPPVPGNDKCAGATPLTITNGIATVSGDTRSATDDGGASCSSASGPDVVYSFTLQSAQAVTAKITRDSSTSSYSPVVYLRSVCASTALADEKGCGTSYLSTATASATSLPVGSYFVWVDGSSKTSGKYTLEVKLDAPIVGPKNDTCATAESLSFTNGVASATSDTTLAKDDESGTCSGYSKDLVYSFSTVGQGVKNVEILVTPKSGSSSYRPVAFVRKTCASTASADSLGCGYASAAGAALSLPLEVVPEGTYFVFVDGFSGSAGAFDLKVTLSKPPPPPANDTCTTPTPLTFTSNVATASGTTIAGMNDTAPSCGYGDTADVVYEMTLAANQKVTATVTRDSASASFSPILSIRTSCALSGSELGCKSASLGTASLTFDYLKADKYFVWVDSGGVRGKFDLKVTLDPPVMPTQGENCFATKPLVFTNNAASVGGSTNTAKHDSSSVVCGGSGPDVVYEFTTTAAHKISATVTPASGSATFEPVIYLRSVCGSKDRQHEFFCDGDNGAGGKAVSAEAFNAPAGTYFFFIDGYAGTKGDFVLSATLSAPVPPPANDTCAGAVELKLGASVSGTTKAAKDDFGTGTASSSCGAISPPVFGPDVVYSYKPTASGTATVTVTPTGTDFDPAVWITTGTCVPDVSTCIRATDLGYKGDSETLSGSVTAGTTYYIYVDSSGTKAGDFTIVVK